ncbi:MAG: O-antigen ligase family protein [Alphaproteobacteria bacterium]|nr:O-antigen ligase family protein [Alphaproteobacteria bacterium]
MEFFILIKGESYENIGFLLFSLVFAVAGVYSTKLFSVLLPFLTCTFFITQKGWQNFKFDLPYLAIFFVLFLGISALSVLSASHEKVALRSFYSLSMTLVFSYIFLVSILKAKPDVILLVYKTLITIGLFLASLLVYQSIVDTFHLGFLERPSHLLKPTGSVLGLLGFVTCAFVWTKDRKVIALFSFILMGLLIKMTICQTAIYAFILSSIFFFISYLAPFWVTRISMVSSFVLLLLNPVLYAYIIRPMELINMSYYSWFLNNSFFHRLLIWEYFSHKFFEKPLLGWGLGSSRYIYDKPKVVGGFSNVIHPHKGVLQAYVELGLFGGILFSLFVAFLFWVVEKYVKDRLSVAVCNATILFGLLLADTTHNLWRNYYLSLCVIAAGMVILFIKDREGLQPAATGHLKQAPIPA